MVKVTTSFNNYFESVLAPLPIEVQSGHIATRSPMYDTIGVDHRYYDKLKLFQEFFLYFSCLGCQQLDQILSNE